MTVTLSSQALIGTKEARTYLQDQGFPADGGDLLKMHINGITSMMLRIMARSKMAWVDGDEVTEHRDGKGFAEMYLREAPIKKIVSVTLYPQTDSSIALTVPTDPATYSDDMWFNPDQGELALKNRVFPCGHSTVLIVYEAGFLTTSDEYKGLKLIALDALAAKWQRWKNKKHGIDSESRTESSVTYSSADFTETAINDIKRYRRTMFV